MALGLVSVADLPGQGVDLGAVSAQARALETAGAGIEDGAAHAFHAWQRVPGAYESTGTEAVYTALLPVQEQGRAVHTALSGARRALDAYVAAAGPVLAQIAQLRAEIEQFGSGVAGAYPKPAPMVADFDAYTSAGGTSAAPHATYASWQDDPAAVATNGALTGRAAHLAEELLQLQAECAAAIRRAGAPSDSTASRGPITTASSSRAVAAGSGGREGCAASTGRTLGGLLHDGYADIVGRASDLVSGTSGAIGLVGSEIPRMWWNAESWTKDTLLPAAGLAGTMALQWGSDRLAEAAAAQQSVNRAILEHPDETVEAALGLATMLGGAAMEAGGVALDITIVGAPAGAALNISGAAVMAAGAGTAALGAGQLATHAMTDDRVDPTYNEVTPQREPHTDYPGRSIDGKYLGEDKAARDLEKKGLDEVDETGQFDDPVLRDHVKAHVGGAEQGRVYDGLAKNPDGRSYTGIEIKSGGASRTREQEEFDALVSPHNPAYAMLNGKRIEITEVLVRGNVVP